MKKSFIGKNVWISKTSSGNNKLNDLLKTKGINVFNLPLIYLTPNDTKQVKKRINSLNDYDWIILPSPNAVSFLYHAINNNPNVNINKIRAQFACLGSKTLRKANSIGIKIDHFSEEPNIENLLSTLALNGEYKILYFTSDKSNARYNIKDLITKEVLYLNKPYMLSSEEKELINKKQIDLIVIYSYSAIDSLCLNARFLDVNVFETPIICIGPKTAEYANSQHFKKVKYSQSIEDKDIFQACLEHL
jgi:uroporphyrinogen-III synthase